MYFQALPVYSPVCSSTVCLVAHDGSDLPVNTDLKNKWNDMYEMILIVQSVIKMDLHRHFILFIYYSNKTDKIVKFWNVLEMEHTHTYMHMHTHTNIENI